MIIVHTLKANVESNTYTVTPFLDIHQFDTNTHAIRINLVNNEDKIVCVYPSAIASLTYVLDNNVNHLETEYPVEIINPYRGELMFVVGEDIVNTAGRGTAYLTITNNGCDCMSTVSFPITISESHEYQPDSKIVTHPLSEEEYNKVSEIINNDISPDTVMGTITLNSGENIISVAKYNKYGQVVGKEDIKITLPEVPSPTPTVSDHYVVTVTDGDPCTCDKAYNEIVQNITSGKIVIFKVVKTDMVIQCPMYSYSEDNDIHFMYINLSTMYHIYEENGTTYVEKN